MAENKENVGTTDQNQRLFVEFEKMIVDAGLPRTMDKILLERYLKISDNKLEDAFALLKHGLELRTKMPQLFTDRDLASKEIETACTTFQFFPLRKLTKDNYKITIIRFHKCDASLYDTVQVIKTALMMFDASYTFYDKDDGDRLADGEIFLVDVVGFSFKQFLDTTKNARTLLFYGKFLQEAAAVQLISNHITNTSSLLDNIMTICRPVMNEQVQNLVHCHKVGSDSILNFIEKDVLPIEYGGTNGTVDEHFEEWLKTFKTKRDYLLNDDNWKITPEDT